MVDIDYTWATTININNYYYYECFFAHVPNNSSGVQKSDVQLICNTCVVDLKTRAVCSM